MTPDQARRLADTHFWQELTPDQQFRFQINEPLLCMPFDVLHRATESVLGRPVWTHEFADFGRLWREYAGDAPAPTLREIIEMIPAEKRVVFVGDAQGEPLR